jgi:sirohydrochlorin ferrochelatase
MHEFALLRQQELPGVPTEVAFIAMARPLLDETLAQVASRDLYRVVVQPHFLFHGELVDSIQRQVAAIAEQCPSKEWFVTPTLADRPEIVTRAMDLLQKVIWDRCREAGIHVVAGRAGD